MRGPVVVAVTAAAAAVAIAFVFPSHERFVVRPLVGTARDHRLVNAWGLAATPTGPWWVANEATGTSTLYDADGAKQALTVAVPGGPTGVVYNAGRGFLVGSGSRAAPGRFIYACEDGRIRAWSPSVPHGWSKQAVVAVDESQLGAVFRGVALAGGRLYAADFHNDRIVVFDSRWRRVSVAGRFRDPSIPAWYAPFDVAALGGHLFVSYAYPAPVDGNDAPSGGYVDEFDLQGRLVAHVARAGNLDEPWGLALAPRGFGRYGGDLLVASFGSGEIDAFAPRAGAWREDGKLPVTVPGVWGIAFGTGGMSGPATTLFYAAGPHTWRGSSENDVRGALGSIMLAR